MALVVLVGMMAIIVPSITGSTPMTILTSSMRPTYPPGTLVIVKPIATSDIRIGTPITYQLESGKDIFITHRVIAISHNSEGRTTFTTKGDANGGADEKPVLPVQVRGEVWYSIPYLGWVNTFVGGGNRGWIVPALAGALFLYAGYLVASSIAASARRKRATRDAAARSDAASRPIAAADLDGPAPLVAEQHS
nr:signal peptidase I [Terrimesophilobacter mesophilus]